MPAASAKPRLRGVSSGSEASGNDNAVVQDMVRCVRTAGLKVTPQRIAVLRDLAADPTHPTAQELFERLRSKVPSMSFATVYNTLGALSAAGLCAPLSLSPGAARFDANMVPHHHAVCDCCGSIRDLPLDVHDVQVESATKRLEVAELGFTLRTVERIYRGVCRACAEATPIRSKSAEAPCR